LRSSFDPQKGTILELMIERGSLLKIEEEEYCDCKVERDCLLMDRERRVDVVDGVNLEVEDVEDECVKS